MGASWASLDDGCELDWLDGMTTAQEGLREGWALLMLLYHRGGSKLISVALRTATHILFLEPENFNYLWHQVL